MMKPKTIPRKPITAESIEIKKIPSPHNMNNNNGNTKMNKISNSKKFINLNKTKTQMKKTSKQQPIQNGVRTSNTSLRNSTSSNGHGTRALSSLALLSIDSHDPMSCERVLNDCIISLKKLLMMHYAGEMSHDMNAVEYHVADRARESVDEELTRIGSRLFNLQGPNPSHRVTAYSQIFATLLEDTEAIIFNQERRDVDLLKLEHLQSKEEAERVQHMLAQELAAKEQTIASLVADRVELEAQVKALQRSHESLKIELGKILQEQTHTHQHAVELRMQGLDYKAEVDRRCERVLRSIQSRMGFIPAGVMKNIQHLRTLKAPGDPAYDVVRKFAYAKGLGFPAANMSAPSPTKESRRMDDSLFLGEDGEDRGPESEAVLDGENGENAVNGEWDERGSLASSGGRISSWAEKIYKSDGLKAFANNNNNNTTDDDRQVDPAVWSQWDEQLQIHHEGRNSKNNYDEQLWGR